MIVRRFNASGIDAFRSTLARLREEPTGSVDHDPLSDGTLTEPIGREIKVDQRAFASKFEAAHYLRDLLSGLDDRRVAEDGGLWSWLTLFFFDQVCPARDGRRTVRNDYHYIFEPRSALYYYRHLLFLPWRILKIAPRHNRLFLNGPLASLEKVTEEVMKRLFLTRIPCMFEVLDLLYWDDRRGKAKVGIASPRDVRPGDLIHRLPVRIRQLEKTYDLHSLSADQLIELLGDEFRQRPAARPPTTAGTPDHPASATG